jgi:carbonic anhydrase/acetyltransferase-like protein (isoleucine patch superfamily)
MSVPASLKCGPHTTLLLIKKRYLFFYIFLIWISIFSIQFEFWLLWKLYEPRFIQFLVLLPLLIFVMYITSIAVSLIFAKIFLVIVNIIHKPKEGVFLRTPSNKDYRYWCIRSIIKKWPLWLSHKFPFPFMDNICLKLFGIKTRYSNSLFEGFIDTEFIEFGKNVTIGQAALIQSAVIVGNLFILKRTVLEDNVMVGAHSIVMPGTYMKKNSILAGSSMTTVGQVLDEDFIYMGAPAKKYKKNVFFEDGLEDEIKKQFKKKAISTVKYEDLYTVRKDKDTQIN